MVIGIYGKDMSGQSYAACISRAFLYKLILLGRVRAAGSILSAAAALRGDGVGLMTEG